MKLLRVTLCNMNSLYGEHHIDFERDLSDAPLFLILGPTGAGKSTILDGVCLALFGQTPRLENARGKEESKPWRIMSHNTGYCWAKVDFAKRDPDGHRRHYRAEWSCRRSYNKAHGKPQSPERGLYRITRQGALAEDSPLVSSTKVTVYQPVFDQILEGFTVEDFQRSMLLPQGQFTAFIGADEDARASILERLTNTSQYQKIGEAAAHRRRAAEAKMKAVQEKLGNLTLLSDLEVDEISAEREEKEAEGARQRALRATLDAQLSWERLDLELSRQAEEAEKRSAAAATAWEAWAPNEALLEKDQRVRPAGALLARRAQLQQSLEESIGAQGGLREEITASEARLEALARQVEVHQAALEEKEKEQARLAPEIRQAYQARQALEQARKEVEDANRVLTEVREEVERLREDLKAADEAMKSEEEIVRRKQDALFESRRLEKLPEAMTGLEAKAEQLKKDERALEKAQDQVIGAQDDLSRCAEDLEDLERQGAKVKASHEAAVEAHRQQEAALKAMLHGAVSPAARRDGLRKKSERVKLQIASIDQLGELITQLEGARDERLQLSQDSRGYRESLRSRQKEIKAAEAEVKAQEEGRKEIQRALDQLRLQLELASHREALVAGEACPLCGALEHPLAGAAKEESLGEEIDAQLKVLEAQEARIEAARGAVTKAKAAEVRDKTRLEDNNRRLTRAEAEVVGLEGEVEVKASSLEISPRASLTDVEAAKAKVQLSLDEFKRQEEALEETLREHARTEREEAARAREVSEENQLSTELRTRKEMLEEQVRERSDEAESMARQLKQQRDGLRREIERFDVELVERDGIPDFKRGLNDLRRSSRQRVQDERALERAQEDFKRAQQHLESLEERLHVREDLERSSSEQARQRERTLSDLESQAVKALGGRDPNEVEAELDSALKEARSQRDTSNTEQLSLTQSLSEARSTLAQSLAREQTLSEELERVKASLAETLVSLSLDDEAALAGLLLKDDQRAEFEEARQTLISERETSAALISQSAEARARHLEGLPEGHAAGADLKKLTKNRGAAEQALEALTLRLGQITQTLEEQEKNAAKNQDLKAELDEAQAELSLWLTIAKLIGTNNGGAFKRFAQILNLFELIELANRWLKRLKPRYTLLPATDDDGLPTLSFAVRDTYQALQERPLTTLSGGETFVVSLAMALGLSDYRTSSLPIETLLLDEGVGTLDKDSLEDVMSALEQLQSTGTQVGLISHVESLKERVAARIVVEPMGNGRSQVKIEGSGGVHLASVAEE